MTTTVPNAVDDLVTRNRGRLDRAAALQRQLESAKPPYTTQTILEPLNDLMVELANVSSESSLLSEVHPELGVREAAERAAQDAAKFATNLGQSRPIYDALGAIDQKT